MRKLIRFQTWLSLCFDRLLPQDLVTDGNREFLDTVVPANLRPGDVVYDIGGGKNPVITARQKTSLGLLVVGVDIDRRELCGAPPGAYDRIVPVDISGFVGSGDADLAICQALLEHVRDSNRALGAIASILKPGGRALIFVPSRNAIYARLNLLLPQDLKRRILFAIFPAMRRDHGFPAFYDRCTPAAFDRMTRRHGLITEDRRLYFHSEYFRFLFPLHAAWRLWTIFFRWIAGPQAAETFTLVLRKTA